MIYDVIYQQNVQEKMTDEESRNEKWKGANARSVKTFCLHLLIIWSFDFYKEQSGLLIRFNCTESHSRMMSTLIRRLRVQKGGWRRLCIGPVKEDLLMSR